MSGFIANAENVPVVLLAGGRSSRMGSNKAFASLGGESLLSRIAKRFRERERRLVALNADADWPDTMGLRLVPDKIPGKLGPLAGVLAAMQDTALHHPQASHVATVPIDSPFFPLDLIERLADAVQGRDEIAIATSFGRDHPVFSLWPVFAAADLETWIVTDAKRRVSDFLARYTVLRVDFPATETPIGPLDPFFNVNTPDDLVDAEKWLATLETTR